MVKAMKRLMGRVELRLLGLVLVCALMCGIVFATALQRTKEQEEDFQTLNTWQELVETFLDFREDSARMVIPFSLPDASMDWAALQTEPFWYWSFEAGVYYFEDGSELSKQIQHNTKLVAYEDIATDEIIILSMPDSKTVACREELAIRAPAWPEPFFGLRTQRALDRELCKRRIVWHVTLKSRRLAEREAALVPLAEEGGGAMCMMALESLTELAITQIKVVSNRMQLGISYPAAYSGTVWSVFSYDAPACPSVEGTAPGPNGIPLPDETNEVTGTTWEGCPLDYSRRFQGLENVWTLVHSNLVLTGETTTLWLDPQPLAVDTNSEPCHRFYGLGNIAVDADGDALADAFELFVFHSDPAQWDSDGDGQSDGAEYLAGTHPGNPNDPPNIAGTVFYSGMQTGVIRVVAATNAEDWAGAWQATLQAPGAFHLCNLPAAQYWVTAYRDMDGDNQWNGLEAACVYSNNPIVLTGRAEGVCLELTELDSDGDGFTDYEEIVVFRSDPLVAGDLPTQYSTASDDVYFGHPHITSTNFVYSTGFLFEDVYMGKGWIINGLFTPDLRSSSATVYYGMPDHLDCTNFFKHSHSPCMHDVSMGLGWATHQGFITDFRQASAPVYYGEPDYISHRSLFVHSLEPTVNYVGMGKGWVTNNGFVADYNEPSSLVYFSRPDWVAHTSLYVYSSSPPGANLQFVAYGWPTTGGFVPDLTRSSGTVYFGSPTLNGPVKNFYYSQYTIPHHSVFVGYGWPTMDGMLASLNPSLFTGIYYGRVQGYSNLYVYAASTVNLVSPTLEGQGWVNLKDFAKYDDPSLDWDGDFIMDYYDPLEKYEAPNDSQTVEMQMAVGDASGSHTEMYSLKVGPFVLRMPYINSNEYLFTQTVQVMRGTAYLGCYLEALGDSDPDGDYDAFVAGNGLLVVDTNDVLGSKDGTEFNSGKLYFDVFVPKVDLLAHKPGTMTAPGMAISRVHEDRPDNLILSVNDDNDDGGPQGHRDFDDRLIHPNDNDIVNVVLKKFLPGSLEKGTLELTVTPSNAVRVYKNSSTLLNHYTLNLASRSGDLMLLPLVDIPLYIEALLPCEEVVIRLAYKAVGGQEICADEVRMRVLKVDLDAMKVSHNAANGELPDTDETSPGAFVPINNDDDDYDASNTEDKDQSGSITGESDLLPIKLHKVDPAVAGSKYTLDIPSQVKIWQNADRSGAISGTTELDANVDTVLYVEGTTVGSGNIKANWKNSATTLNACDEIKVTVFDWVGPLNVPDYSIHRYTASGALGSSQWTTPVNGTIKTGAGSSDITVLWSGGPVIGKAVYQVNSDYLWDLEMNVVEVKIDAPSAGNAFTAGSTAYQGDMNFGVYGPVASSGSPGMLWKAKITMSGPSANGVDHRGVTHIEVGFVQNLTFTTCRGDFTVSGVPQSLTANIQGNSYHDIINGQPPGTVYYYTGGNYTFKPTGTSAAARTKDPLEGQDTPTAGVPLYYKKGIALNPPNDDMLDSMHWTGTFNLWITARTEDAVNGSDVIYTCRGSGDWLFTVNEAYPMSNPLGYSSVTVPSAWSAVTDGSTPTLTAGQTANQALAGIAY